VSELYFLKLYLKDLVVDGMIILKLFFKKQVKGVDWINVPKEGNRFWAVVNTALNIRLHTKGGTLPDNLKDY
jgi:hypothetical protein